MFKEKRRHRPQISNTWVLLAGVCVCLLDCQLVKGWVHTQKTHRFKRNHSGLLILKKNYVTSKQLFGFSTGLMTVIPFPFGSELKNILYYLPKLL